MYKNLNAGAIGIKNLTLPEVIELAQQAGFGGIDFDIREAAVLTETDGVDAVKAMFADAGIRPGAWGPPVDWRNDEAKWQADLEALPKLAALAAELGATRATTWIMPGSDEREYETNYEWHITRLRPVAEALKAEGIYFGLEFIGPQSLRESFQYPFIYTMGAMLGLGEDIGTGNVGLLLDAYHWYTSGGTAAELAPLKAKQVVVVHVNDAPVGLTMAEYQDLDRRLPTESGVIDLEAFMKALAAMGYEGPVTTEPFSKRVNELDSSLEAAQLTAEHMDRLWAFLG